MFKISAGDIATTIMSEIKINVIYNLLNATLVFILFECIQSGDQW